jgi:hypothetical protein
MTTATFERSVHHPSRYTRKLRDYCSSRMTIKTKERKVGLQTDEITQTGRSLACLRFVNLDAAGYPGRW